VKLHSLQAFAITVNYCITLESLQLMNAQSDQCHRMARASR